MAKFGKFSGEPELMAVAGDHGEHGDRQVMNDFWYVDPAKRRWDVPRGSIIDGAALPRALWTLVGNPLDGSYCRASIVHDVACNRKVSSAADMHRADADRMFFYACMADGCTRHTACMLYAAIRLGATVNWMEVELLPAADIDTTIDPGTDIATDEEYEFVMPYAARAYTRRDSLQHRERSSETHLLALFQQIVDDIPPDSEPTLDELDEIVARYV